MAEFPRGYPELIQGKQKNIYICIYIMMELNGVPGDHIGRIEWIEVKKNEKIKIKIKTQNLIIFNYFTI